MWEVKNISFRPIESPVTKIRFIPDRVLSFEMDSLPTDIQFLVDKGLLNAVRTSSSLDSQLKIERELYKIADEIFLDWEI